MRLEAGQGPQGATTLLHEEAQSLSSEDDELVYRRGPSAPVNTAVLGGYSPRTAKHDAIFSLPIPPIVYVRGNMLRIKAMLVKCMSS